MLLVVDGLKVKTIRRALGISQRECCKRAGISRRALQRMEMGCDSRPATVRSIAAVLGVDAEALARPKHRGLGRLIAV